jgi:hypothetical protein
MNEDGRWKHAGKGITAFFKDNHVLQKLFGFSRDCRKHPSGRLWKNLGDKLFSATQAGQSWLRTLFAVDPFDVTCWERVGVASGDMCGVGTFAMFDNHTIGRIKEILEYNGRIHVIYEKFEITGGHVSASGCPKLRNLNSLEVRLHTQILGPVNIQHDCRQCGCRPRLVNAQIERENVESRASRIIHENDIDFLLNIHCLRTPWVLPFIPVEPSLTDVDIVQLAAELCAMEWTNIQDDLGID